MILPIIRRYHSSIFAIAGIGIVIRFHGTPNLHFPVKHSTDRVHNVKFRPLGINYQTTHKNARLGIK